MSLLDNIGKFKIGGSINTQFQTGNALERIAIASGQQVGGFTSFLVTLEFLGYLLLIALSLFIISAFTIIYTLIFLARLWSWIFPSAEVREERANYMTDEELDEKLAKFELTAEDEEEIMNMH